MSLAIHVPVPEQSEDTFNTLNISDKILILAYDIHCRATIERVPGMYIGLLIAGCVFRGEAPLLL